jgi:hypothetical protein
MEQMISKQLRVFIVAIIIIMEIFLLHFYPMGLSSVGDMRPMVEIVLG